MSLRASEYLRPSTLAEALSLLSRASPPSQPLAGGTYLALSSGVVGALVDLRGLSLEGMDAQAGQWRMGAMATLADLAGHPGLPEALRGAARHEAPGNLQGMATLGGTVAVGASGPLLCALLASGARVEVQPGDQQIPIEDLVLGKREKLGRGRLIIRIAFADGRGLGLAEISRTPEDRPLVCLSIGARWDQGRIREVRVACGAYGQPLALLPEVAVALEGQILPITAEGLQQAAVHAEVSWVEDIRGSSDYRASMVPVLLKRAADQLSGSGPARP
jgi:CO/xanthine dehydrogenase FAD-binding subunit